MASQLVEIQPSELKFMFEARKQSSCSVQLLNKSDQWVAYKVKTTNPKKYYVRPNNGSISPNSACEFIVTMQAQPSAPPGMLCRDKFLVQTTVLLPNEITEQKISQDLFAKEKGRVVEEKKLRVSLISPSPSPVLQPINGLVRQEVMYDVLKPNERECSTKESNEPPSPTVAKEVVGLKAKIRQVTSCFLLSLLNEICYPCAFIYRNRLYKATSPEHATLVVCPTGHEQIHADMSRQQRNAEKVITSLREETTDNSAKGNVATRAC